jgi:hypothetical protein
MALSISHNFHSISGYVPRYGDLFQGWRSTIVASQRQSRTDYPDRVVWARVNKEATGPKVSRLTVSVSQYVHGEVYSSLKLGI